MMEYYFMEARSWNLQVISFSYPKTLSENEATMLLLLITILMVHRGSKTEPIVPKNESSK